jgi:hypothetical protein
MTANPFLKSQGPEAPRRGRTQQEICDQGNEYVRQCGRAHEVEWRIENGQAIIDWIRAPRRPQIVRQPYSDN